MRVRCSRKECDWIDEDLWCCDKHDDNTFEIIDEKKEDQVKTARNGFNIYCAYALTTYGKSEVVWREYDFETVMREIIEEG